MTVTLVLHNYIRKELNRDMSAHKDDELVQSNVSIQLHTAIEASSTRQLPNIHCSFKKAPFAI